MQYMISAYSETGNFRERNEDSVFAGNKIVNSGGYVTVCEAPFIVSVADGVGGENSGDIASKIVSEKLSQTVYTSPEEFKETIFDIHREIRDYSERNPESRNLQTTLCCLGADAEGKLCCFNTGDSRLYFYKGEKVRQVSEDHSYVRLLFERGEISEDEMLDHPQKNIITSSLGTPSGLPRVDIFPVAEKLSPGEAVILCSDGVSDFVGCMEIEAAMSLDTDFGEKIKALAELALERGSSDNVSVAGVIVCPEKEIKESGE